MIMEIRRFEPKDAEETAAVIAETTRISNSKDYPPEYIEALTKSHSAEVLKKRAEEGHMYVLVTDGRIIGCGTIAPFWGSPDESILLTIFILPEFQGKGFGRQLISVLEQDEYGIRAKRIEIPASITGVQFYRKLGYDWKNSDDSLENGVLYRLEKHMR